MNDGGELEAQSLSEDNEASLVGLAEPFKIRVISKGPVFRQTFLSKVQSFMHGVMRRHPCFRLIGETLTPLYLTERLGYTLGVGEGFVSGDYRDATNQICSWASNVACDRICENLGMSNMVTVLFQSSLTGHTIIHNGVSRKQMNGQLMGSVTSFPILCLINAAICRKAIEAGRGSTVSLNDAPLGINGDDCVFRTTPFGMQVWRCLGDAIGLDESVGKTYYSDEFCEMNSRAFLFRKGGDRESGPCFKQVPLVNLGLLFNRGRSGKGDKVGSERSGSIGQKCRDLVGSAPEMCRDWLMKNFIRRNYVTLSAMKGLPWYVPEQWGGVGLPLWNEGGIPHGPTELDMQIFLRVEANYGHREPRAIVEPSLWLLRKVASDTFPISRVEEKSVTPEELSLSDEFLGYVYGFVAATYDVGRLYRNLKGDELMKRSRWAIRHNQRLWSPSKGGIPGLPESQEDRDDLLKRMFSPAPKMIDFIGIELMSDVSAEPTDNNVLPEAEMPLQLRFEAPEVVPLERNVEVEWKMGEGSVFGFDLTSN
nr:RNA-dependent RNA polymerase [Flumine narna-like virus 29]